MTPFGFEYGMPPGLVVGGRPTAGFECGAALVVGFGEAGDFLLFGDTRLEVVNDFTLQGDTIVEVAPLARKINSLDYGYLGSFMGRSMAGFEVGPHLVINDSFFTPFVLDGDTRLTIFNLVDLEGDTILDVAPAKRLLNSMDCGALGLVFGNGRLEVGAFDQGYPPGGVLPWLAVGGRRRGWQFLMMMGVSARR